MRSVIVGLLVFFGILGGGGTAHALDWSSFSFFATRAEAPEPALTTVPRILRYGGDSASGAPYTFKDPANPSRTIGLEVDIMAQLAPRLGGMPIFVQNQSDMLIAGLGTDLYEVAVTAPAITPETAAPSVNFSIPYYTTFGQIVIRRGDPAITGLKGLKDKTVGTLKATQIAEILSRSPNIVLKTYDTPAEVFSDLRRGRIDAAVVDFPIAVYHARPDRALQFTGDPIGRIQYAVALKRGTHPEVLGALNTAIYAMSQDGSLRRILDRWALWTPVMAQEVDDKRPMQAEPSAYEHFVEASTPRSFISEVERYVRFLPQILRGVVMTLELSLLAMVTAMVVGAVLAVTRVHGGPVLGRVARAYMDGMRGIPLLIVVLFVYYGLPTVGVQLDPLMAGVLALGLSYAAYVAENVRIGLRAIPRDQMEAAIVLNMTELQALRNVILPQAARIMLPPTARNFVSLIKDSSLVSVLPLLELTKTYQQISVTYSDYFGTGLLVAAIYLVISLPFVRLAKWAELYAGRGMSRLVP